jgi:hypothetical protein
MWTLWGEGYKREGQFGGIEPQKRVKVELIEWRSIDLHSIDSKSTFHPPQSGKCTGTYSACNLGVRLRYQRHGEHGLKVRPKDEHIQYQSVLQKGGFSPCNFHFISCYVIILKNYNLVCCLSVSFNSHMDLSRRKIFLRTYLCTYVLTYLCENNIGLKEF